MHRGEQRLTFLDGLRGVAISLVFAYHIGGVGPAFYLPGGSRYAGFPIVQHGWIGVYLFFLISGFVIFKTIKRCTSLPDFLLRRWTRLFPAMLFATVLLFSLDRSLHLPGRFSSPNLRDTLPGLLFISNSVLQAVLRVPMLSLDDTFWTLYVEASFYLIFGTLYFRLGERRAIGGLIAIFVAVETVLTLVRAGLVPGTASRLLAPAEWLGLQYFGWFASGILFFKAWDTRNRRTFVAALAMGLLAVAMLHVAALTLLQNAMAGSMLLLFAAALTVAPLQSLLATRPLLFVGGISYPLYLVHSNLGTGLVVSGVRRGLPQSIATLATTTAMILLAWAIARWIEPPLAVFARRAADRVRLRFAISRS